MRRMLLAVLAMIVLFPPPVACQTGRGTVIVVDRSRLTVVVTPASYTGEVGDTIRFMAEAFDTISGEEVPAVFTWTSLDPTGVSIDRTTGLATLLRAGTFEVEAFVETIVALIITRQYDDGSWREIFTVERQPYYSATGVVPDSLTLEVGQEVPLCAYLEASSGLHYVCIDCEWRASNTEIASVTDVGGTSICPEWDIGLPFPHAALQIPRDAFQRGARVG